MTEGPKPGRARREVHWAVAADTIRAMIESEHPPAREKRRGRIGLRAAVLVLAIASAGAGGWWWHRNAMPRRFAEVKAGQIYRGGYPTQDHLRRLADDYQVRTVVSLTGDAPESQEACDRQAVGREKGLRLLSFPMPGNGLGDFDKLDAAADALADPGNYPVFFHCAAGKQRSNAAMACYRMKHCGWSFDDAMAELDRHGLDREEEAALVEHLRRYYRERVVGKRSIVSTDVTDERR